MRRARARRTATAAASSASPHPLGSGDRQRVQLPLRVGAGLDRGAASGQMHLQRGPLSTALGLGQVGAGQRVPGSAHRVDRIGLGPGPSLRPHGPVQFDHHLVVLGQVLGQAGAVPAAAFHRPGPQPRVLFGEGS